MKGKINFVNNLFKRKIKMALPRKISPHEKITNFIFQIITCG